MRMRNRLSNGSKHVAFAACMLALGVNFSACTDDYVLDDQKPAWLNSSIYETLENNGGYTKFLTLIADPDVNSGDSEGSSLVEILSRTGSKTVFVANDKAWDAFFASNAKLPEANPWHNATSYDKLSQSQKKLLLHTCMLNNAIVMENLSNSAGTEIKRGQYLRRNTDVELVDSIEKIDLENLPKSYWSLDRQANPDAATPVVDQWSRIRNGGLLGYKSIYLGKLSQPMMLHFTNDFMANKKITDEDFRIFMGRTRTTFDVHIYDAHLDSADITCENGYVNMTEKPLVPLPNMADIIHTYENSRVYSHLLDLFSVPYQNSSLGRLFARVHPELFQETDTLYTKRYYSSRSYGGSPLTSDERGNTFNESKTVLRYDPGWNGYYPSRASSSQEDMGAIFVPNDQQFVNYFNSSYGRYLIDEYVSNPAGNYSVDNLEELFMDIDQIPLDRIAYILNHTMFDSFVESVPSKMESQREESSLEAIFHAQDTKLVADGGNIDTVMMGCNGAVYIMNNVYMPSDFHCVATPVFIRSSNRIMYWSIYSDKDLVENGKRPYIGFNFFAYLKSMQSKYSFFIPNDDAMSYYYDPMSFSSRIPRVVKFVYTSGDFPFLRKYDATLQKGVVAQYNIADGTIERDRTGSTLTQEEIVRRIRQILENHTFAHDNGINAINTEEDEYYLSKNGMGMKVIRERNEKGEMRVTKVQGGFQLENERENVPHVNPGIQYCKVVEKGEYDNGWAFTLDAPIIPAARSVFSVLSNIKRGQQGTGAEYTDEAVVASNRCYQFFKLCMDVEDELITKSGLVNESDYDLNTSEGRTNMTKAINKYKTFVDNNAVDYNVQFFGNYRYTVFAPENKYIEEAIRNGLPTWESIHDDYENCDKDADGKPVNEDDAKRLRYKIVYLTNFIRSHFADNTIFADKSELGSDAQPVELSTNSYDKDNGVFVKAFVKRVKEGGQTVLKVRDATSTDQWRSVSSDERYRNIMACDRVNNKAVKGKTGAALNDIYTETTSYSVVHYLEGVINHQKLVDGKYPDFDNQTEARKYLRRFAIR